MEPGKRKVGCCCISDALQQASRQRRENYILKQLLCQNAAYPRNPCAENYYKDYLTHSEGRINYKKDETNVCVNMDKDANETKERELFKCYMPYYRHNVYCKEETPQINKHLIVRSPTNSKTIKAVPKNTCIGKIIHIDSITQTDAVFQKRNKGTGIIKKKNIYTHYNDDVDRIHNIIKQKQKFDTYKEICENMVAKKSSKCLEQRRRRSRTICIWPWRVKEHDRVDCTNNKRKIVLECLPPNEQKLNATCKHPKKNRSRNLKNRSCKYKGNLTDCTDNTCGIPTMNNEVRSKSLKDVKRNKSLITCLRFNSRKNLSKKRSLFRKPVYLKLNACNKGIKVAIVDNRCEPVCQRMFSLNKIKNKKRIQNIQICKQSQKKDQTSEAIIRIGVDKFGRNVLNLGEIKHKRADPIQKNNGESSFICPSYIKNKKPKKIDICINTIPKKVCNQRRGQLISTVDVIEKCLYSDEIKNKQTDPRQKFKEKRPCIGPCKLKNQKPKKIEICGCTNTTPQNNVIEKCVCPDKIKNKLTALTQTYKPTCVRPSHHIRREQYPTKNVCERRISQKMIKNKIKCFTCNCERIQEVDECTNRTCGSSIKKIPKKCANKCIRLTEITKPQFGVQLESKKCCGLNAEDSSQNIMDIEAEVCVGGTCAVARCENRKLFKHKCIQKKSEERAQDMCVRGDSEAPVDLLDYWMSKLFNKINAYSSKNRMKRNAFDTDEINKIKSMFSFIRDRLTRTSEIWNGSETTKKTSCPGMQPQRTNYHRRSGLNVPLGRSHRTLASVSKTRINARQGKVDEETSVSLTNSIVCGCAKELKKRKSRQGKDNGENYDKEGEKMRKERLRKQKMEEKKRIAQLKAEQKEMQEFDKRGEADETSCLADFIKGIFNIGFGITHCLLWLLFKIITEPEVTFRKARQHIKYPKRAFEQVLKWAADKWRRQKFYMKRSIKGSQSLTILSDEIYESRVGQAFAEKGETYEEKRLIKSKHRRRIRRIRKRDKEAMASCNILLMSMRKRPCLWVYHLWPNFYPRFLALRLNFIKMGQVFLFCFAMVVWTPCILCCELCRGAICCVSCGQ